MVLKTQAARSGQTPPQRRTISSGKLVAINSAPKSQERALSSSGLSDQRFTLRAMSWCRSSIVVDRWPAAFGRLRLVDLASPEMQHLQVQYVACRGAPESCIAHRRRYLEANKQDGCARRMPGLSAVKLAPTRTCMHSSPLLYGGRRPAQCFFAVTAFRRETWPPQCPITVRKL
ncbi:hypothetical protein GQ53DRAFT_473841 [Thozetella sp. PMI_491]|nr:hypothetical protein GQ53DRAFT_473841 [Thozetella sp. PMI_491]